MFLTVDELYTHLHDETVAVISRDTEAIPVAAIDAAIAEAKSYLHDFDTAAIFSAQCVAAAICQRHCRVALCEPRECLYRYGTARKALRQCYRVATACAKGRSLARPTPAHC